MARVSRENIIDEFIQPTKTVTMLTWLRLKYQNVRNQLFAETPKQKFKLIYFIGNMISKSVGVHVYSDLKVNWYTGICGFLGFIYLLLCIYTFQNYFHQNNLVRAFQCTCLTGITIIVRVLLLSFFFKNLSL